jgi:hypothetical protein
MKLNDMIVAGKVSRPVKFALYGTQGIGKTWLAANGFPNPVIIDLERGSDTYDCAKIFVANDEQLQTALDLLLRIFACNCCSPSTLKSFTYCSSSGMLIVDR